MIENGIQPEIIVPYQNLSERKALELEEILIQTYGRRCEGGCLCNLQPGGENPPNWTGRQHTSATRKKMSSIPRTKDWRHRIGMAHKGKVMSRETRQLLREIHQERMCPVEAVDLKTGQIVHYFQCLKDAERAGFDRVQFAGYYKSIQLNTEV